MFEGSTPSVDVATAAASLVLEPEVDDVTATLLAGGEDPTEKDATTLLAALADTTV